MSQKPFEIFSGTGGVGKTTLACSRALMLSKKGFKVLLITIDPSKRLKEVLGLSEQDAGSTVTIKNPTDSDKKLDVQLMNPSSTIKRIAQISSSEQISNNRILKILTKPYGGLNEILSIIELQINHEKNIYDTIILDTPPGAHFVDFLNGVHKIKEFFGQNFIDIFNYIDEKFDSSKLSLGKKMWGSVVSKGVKKLLSYLGSVTGAKFIDDFIESIQAIYSSKDTFLKAISFQENLQNPHSSRWFLVTSVDQAKTKEAVELSSNASQIISNKAYIIINKSLNEFSEEWKETEDKSFNNSLRESIIKKESNLISEFKNKFSNILTFSEIIKVSPIDHVISLSSQWELKEIID